MSSENIEKSEAPVLPDFRESDEDCAVFLKRNQLSDTPPVPADTLVPTKGLSTRRFTALLQKYLVIPTALAILAGIFWTLTCLLDFDWNIGHVNTGSVWFLLTLLALAAGGVFAVLLAVPARRTRQYRLSAVTLSETFCSLFAAALLGISGLRSLYEQFTTPPAAVSVMNTAALGKLAAVGMLFCAACFLCMGLGKKGHLLSAMSMAACVGVMLILFRDYFDFTLPLNSPLRNITTLAWASILLFFVAEARSHVDLWYTDVAFTVCTNFAVILFCGGFGLGQTILALLGYTQFQLLTQTAFLITAVLAFFRLKNLSSLLGDHIPPPPTEEEVKKAAKKSRKQVPSENK